MYEEFSNPSNILLAISTSMIYIPVVFLILMVPILKKIEKKMLEEAGTVGRNQGVVDVEVLSFVDDICMDIVDWEANVKRIVRKRPWWAGSGG